MTGVWQRQQCGYGCSYGTCLKRTPRSCRSLTRSSSAFLKNCPPTSGTSAAK